MRLHERHVLVGRGVEDHLGPVAGQHLRQLVGVLDVHQRRGPRHTRMRVGQLRLDLEESPLVAVQQHQERRLHPRHLPADLRPNAAAGPRHQHPPAAERGANRPGVEPHRLPPQQVLAAARRLGDFLVAQAALFNSDAVVRQYSGAQVATGYICWTQNVEGLSALFQLTGDSRYRELAAQMAALAEVPIIATNVGGIPDIIEHNVSGIIVPPESSTHIAGAIETLINKKDLRETFIQHAKNAVLENFTFDKMLEKTLKVYAS